MAHMQPFVRIQQHGMHTYGFRPCGRGTHNISVMCKYTNLSIFMYVCMYGCNVRGEISAQVVAMFNTTLTRFSRQQSYLRI